MPSIIILPGTAKFISSTSLTMPGHVDFTMRYRGLLAACEGAIFAVDAPKGIARPGQCPPSIGHDLRSATHHSDWFKPAGGSRTRMEIEGCLIGLDASEAVLASPRLVSELKIFYIDCRKSLSTDWNVNRSKPWFLIQLMMLIVG